MSKQHEPPPTVPEAPPTPKRGPQQLLLVR